MNTKTKTVKNTPELLRAVGFKFNKKEKLWELNNSPNIFIHFSDKFAQENSFNTIARWISERYEEAIRKAKTEGKNEIRDIIRNALEIHISS